MPTPFDPVTGWAVIAQGAFAVPETAMIWDVDRWDLATWNAGPMEATAWVDLTCNVTSAAVRVGATQSNGVLTRYESSTLDLNLYDPTRLLDPFNTATGLVRFGRLRQRAGLRLVARHVSDPDADHVLFTGFLESLEYTWLDRTARIVGADAASYLALYDPPPGEPLGQGDSCSERVERILDTIDWPDELRDIRDGGAPLIADTLDGTTWDELLAVAEADLGLLCVRTTGVVTFIPRDEVPWQIDPSCTVGDGSGLPIVDATGTDVQPPINSVTASRVDGPEITRNDATSAAMYGFAGQPLFYALSRKDLPFTTDAAVTEWVGAVLQVHAYPDPRVSPISLRLADTGTVISDTLAWADVASVQIGDRWNVRCSDLGISKDHHVRGWAFEILHDGRCLQWNASVVTTSAAWATPMVWDDEKLGFWDDFRWA